MDNIVFEYNANRTFVPLLQKAFDPKMPQGQREESFVRAADKAGLMSYRTPLFEQNCKTLFQHSRVSTQNGMMQFIVNSKTLAEENVSLWSELRTTHEIYTLAKESAPQAACKVA